MTPIRPFEPGDVEAVATLYEQVIRSRTAAAPPGLAEYFRRTTLQSPCADPEIPSLVYDDPSLGVVGFIASHPRPFTLGDRPIRMACSGQLVAREDVRSRGVGALLMRAYLAGPQDLTVTDGATEEVRDIWQRLGGVTNPIASLGWTRVFGPTGFGAGALARRRAPDGNPSGEAPAAGLWSAVDALVGRPVRPPAPEATSEPLTPAAALELLPTLRRPFALRPAYDEGQLAWLFEQMELVVERGPLVRRLVRDRAGKAVGWYVAYVPRAGIADVMQVVANPADVGLVLDELFHHAAGLGAVAVSGRIDPYLYAALTERRCVFRRSGWVLVRSDDAELLAAIGFGGALLTRMDGEWWMGHHVLGRESLARLAAGG